MSLPIALQLYTVRDVLSADFEAGLREVAAIGYTRVEFAGLYGKTPDQARQICDTLGLTVVCSHTGLQKLLDTPGEDIALAKKLGFKHLVISSLPAPMKNPAGYRQAAADMTAIGRRLADEGLSLCYHNHSFEWDKLEDGSRGIDILHDNVDPALVKHELDVYWVQHGGDDPLDWMRKLSGRAPLLHIKDMGAGDDRPFAEVGTGVVDIPGVVKLAPSTGAEYLIVEQDRHWKDDSPMESARISFENLTRIVASA